MLCHFHNPKNRINLPLQWLVGRCPCKVLSPDQKTSGCEELWSLLPVPTLFFHSERIGRASTPRTREFWKLCQTSFGIRKYSHYVSIIKFQSEDIYSPPSTSFKWFAIFPISFLKISFHAFCNSLLSLWSISESLFTQLFKKEISFGLWHH